MHRFYLPPADCRAPVLWLTPREAHHAQHVLRLRRGDSVVVLDGEGQTLECEIAGIGRDQVELKVLQRRIAPPLACRITLGQAVPKGKKFEEIIEKATELGVARIVPLLTERTIGKLDPADQARKLAKWRLAAIEAIKQCGSAWLPHVEPPASLEQFAAEQHNTDLPLVGSLAPGARHPRTCFEEFKLANGSEPKSVSVCVGPEGDLTPEELAALQSDGAQPITLGPLVLRTDTAAIYCLSVINYELQAGARTSLSAGTKADQS